MTKQIQKLPANQLGNDYVIGDLHGCYSLLSDLLERVEFNPKSDRLLSVGDLIDRGPDSLRCLQLLNEPWFHSILGNHEKMLLDFFKPYMESGYLTEFDRYDDTGFLDNGGEWVNDYYIREQRKMTPEFNHCLALVKQLPTILIVGEGQDRVNLVHAELIRQDYKTSNQLVWTDYDLDDWYLSQSIPASTENRLVWGRTLMLTLLEKVRDMSTYPGLSPTFCGHSYDTSIRQALSHICLDTGAYASLSHDEDANNYGLTLYDLTNNQLHRASYSSARIKQ
jgi:serine/threonine protein phosphatase 1